MVAETTLQRCAAPRGAARSTRAARLVAAAWTIALAVVAPASALARASAMPNAPVPRFARRATNDLVATAASARSLREERPYNVLFVVDDQHNARVLGCEDHALAVTPNIDRLARQGTRFPLAFTQSAQCCPSRYTTWTGRYPRSHGLRWNGMREPIAERTIFERLREHGYVTATVGKHHMLEELDEHGFDRVVDIRTYGRFIADAHSADVRRGMLWGEFDRELGDALGQVGTLLQDNEHHKDGFFATQGIEFIREHAEMPWALWLSFFGPHTPITPSRPWADWFDPDDVELPPSYGAPNERRSRDLGALSKRFAGTSRLSPEMVRRATAAYLAYIAQIDHNIGRVLDELDRLGLAERTIVVFTSDHGELMGEHGSWRKGVFGYDATMRVPLVVRGPGGRAGQVRRELVGLVDLAPTILDWCGLEPAPAMQGRSLLPIVRGESVPWRDWIQSEMGYPGARTGWVVIARDEWTKYVRTQVGDTIFEELFDLRRDPWEIENRFGAIGYGGVTARLKERLADWEARTENAPVLPVEPRAERKPAPR